MTLPLISAHADAVRCRLDEILGTHVRVNLRCGYAGMAEQLLYGTAHPHAALNQMRREGMAQGMRSQRLGDVRTLTGGSMISTPTVWTVVCRAC